MPTYDYKRADGTVFELSQPITAKPLTHCPTTGQSVRRVISGGTGFILKGTGFYQTDYAPNSVPKEESSSSKSETKDSPVTTSDKSEDKKKPAVSKKEE